MKITVDTEAMRMSAIVAKTISASEKLNKITDSAEYSLLTILLDEIRMIEADNNIDRAEIPCLTRFKNAYGITYVEAAAKILSKYLAIRTGISEQLVDAYKEIEDLKG